MVSNQMISETLQKIEDISGTALLACLPDGSLVSALGSEKSDEVRNLFRILSDSQEEEVLGDRCYYKVYDGGRLEMLIGCANTPEEKMIAQMAVLQMGSLILVYQERYDKDSFIKNLLLDNLLLVDIYNNAKKLNIDPRARRVTYLVETKSKDESAALEMIRTITADNPNDFVAAIDENNIVYVRELQENEGEQEMLHTAEVLADTLNAEAMLPVRVAYGNPADEIRKVSNSYKEAKLALSVGKIFNSDQNVVAYSSLGIGRLIYQLPIPMCKMFIEEIFKGQSPEDFDEETLSTINQFFENNLNVSETSRQLYIHRNTLVYRLDKLQKNTGLDLRVFDDAITFKIALMVVQYMHYMENQE